MEFEIQKEQEKLKLKDGLYSGIIEAISYRDSVGKGGKKFQIANLQIGVDLPDVTGKVWAGYPAFVRPKSLYGELLARFGANVTPGLKVNDELLVGKKCQFMVVQQGIYCNVIRESLKPKEG